MRVDATIMTRPSHWALRVALRRNELGRQALPGNPFHDSSQRPFKVVVLPFLTVASG